MFEKNDVIESKIRLSLQTDTLILILGTKQTVETSGELHSFHQTEEYCCYQCTDIPSRAHQ